MVHTITIRKEIVLDSSFIDKLGRQVEVMV